LSAGCNLFLLCSSFTYPFVKHKISQYLLGLPANSRNGDIEYPPRAFYSRTGELRAVLKTESPNPWKEGALSFKIWHLLLVNSFLLPLHLSSYKRALLLRTSRTLNISLPPIFSNYPQWRRTIQQLTSMALRRTDVLKIEANTRFGESETGNEFLQSSSTFPDVHRQSVIIAFITR